MISKSAFNMEFWLLTLGLLLFWTLVLSTGIASAAVQSGQQKQLRLSNEKKSPMHERNCKTLCKQCGCMGFYCGEECICECNNASSKIGSECLEKMRSEAVQRRIPFQLLIQGSNRNRLLRKAVDYNQKTFGVTAPKAINAKKRSSVLIYKPVTSKSNLLENHSKSTFKRSNVGNNFENKRPKRSVGHLEWFSDFANTLVRPAPLGGKKRSNQALDSDETITQMHSKRAANKQEIDRSWFADSPSLLLRPAPLFKKQRNMDETVAAPAATTNLKDDDDNSFELPIRGVAKFPKVLQDTLRNLHDTTIGGGETGNGFGDTLRNHIKESANVLQSQFSDGNLEFLPTNGLLGDNIQQTLSQFFTPNNDNDRPTQMVQQQQQITLPKMPKKFTWFRPVRFLRRVQQAIN